MSYYVYIVSVDGIDRYVGEGKGNRYLHGLSGISSCKELNRDYFSGRTLTVRFIFTGLSKLTAIEKEAETIRSYGDNQLYNKLRLSTRLRKNKGLKFNKITSKEIEMVLHHWLSHGRSNLKRSFQHVYDTTDKTNKEIDWVTGILNSKSFGRELTNAFNTTKHDSIDLVKNSKTFNISRFYNKESLSRRIRQLDIELVYEELLIEKEEKIKELEEALTLALKAKTWEDQALLLLQQGKSQKQVAEELGKGIATISRLVKKVKDKEK